MLRYLALQLSGRVDPLAPGFWADGASGLIAPVAHAVNIQHMLREYSTRSPLSFARQFRTWFGSSRDTELVRILSAIGCRPAVSGRVKSVQSAQSVDGPAPQLVP